MISDQRNIGSEVTVTIRYNNDLSKSPIHLNRCVWKRNTGQDKIWRSGCRCRHNHCGLGDFRDHRGIANDRQFEDGGVIHIIGRHKRDPVLAFV